MRYRDWVFTIFDRSPTFLSWDERTLPRSIRTLVYQAETCPTSGRSHYQGYVEFTSPQRLLALGGLLGVSSGHYERRAGSRKQPIDYCRKDSTRVEGTQSTFLGAYETSQGSRSDLQAVVEAIEEGASLPSVISSFPVQYIKYSRGVERYHLWARRGAATTFRKVRTCVLWGSTGVGKTRAAIELGQDTWYKLSRPNGSSVWFDGYYGETTLILDEFRGWLKYDFLLQLLDGHPLRLPTKGGFTWAEWTTVIITSNQAPADWYQFFANAGVMPALERRLTLVTELNCPLDFTESLADQMGWLD